MPILTNLRPEDPRHAHHQAALQHAAHLRALTEELEAYEGHAASAKAGKNSDGVAMWTRRAGEVRAAIELHIAATPVLPTTPKAA